MIMHMYAVIVILKHTCFIDVKCFSFSICYCSCKCCCSSLHYIMYHPSTSTDFIRRTLQERFVYLCGYLSIVDCGNNTLL